MTKVPDAAHRAALKAGLDVQVDPATGREFIELIDGLKVWLAPDEELEKAKYVICGPDSAFDDDVHTTCAFCGSHIVHRPYIPAAATKICLPCVTKVVPHAERH